MLSAYPLAAGSDRRCRDKAVPYRACASVQLQYRRKGGVGSFRLVAALAVAALHTESGAGLDKIFVLTSQKTQAGKHVKNNTKHKQKG